MPTLHPVIVNVLKNRGLNPSQVEEFLSWDLKALPDLTNLLDIKKASKRIVEAINNNEKIGIFGDYDVDGTTSCALFYHFFQLLQIEVELFQPSRFVEGYGIHPSSIDLALQKNIKVLISVDCGITNDTTADYALENEIDLIITDHHNDTLDAIPNAYAVVNPSRRDQKDTPELKPLAGVGVAFAVALAIKNELGDKCPSIYPLLQFVAIGTICDIAKLTPMNLKLVRHGLKQIPQTKYAGIKAFFPPEERKLGFIPSEKLSFKVGPMINSKGRLDHPEKALKLLIANDSETAYQYFSHLEISNNERKFIQAEVYSRAKEQIINSIRDDHRISIVYQPDWHEGVIGIVASKLVENFKVPAIVFTNSSEDGIIKASARSAGELDLFECLKSCSDLFIKFGGHKKAAGLSMSKENLPILKSKLNEILSHVPENLRIVKEQYDLEISPKDITPELVRGLELIEPFGEGNRKPIFRINGIHLDSYDILKDVHVRWTFSDPNDSSIKVRGISFNYIDSWNASHPSKLYKDQSSSPLDIIFTLGINRFGGNEYIQLMVDQISFG